MADDLKARVHQEIQKTGFPLELRTADYLQRRNYHVAHNVYFLDRDEGKGREIDLRGLKNAFFERGGTRYAVRHCLLLECKKSVSRPWVVFTSPAVSYDQDVTQIQTGGAKDGQWFLPTSEEDLLRFEEAHPWFSTKQRGRSFFEPFGGSSENNQAIFKALVSVVKALIDVRTSGFAARHPYPGGMRDLAFYYPLVVLEGQLFTARLESSGLVVEEASAIPVSLYYRSPQYGDEEQYTVLITRETALQSEIERLDDWLLQTAAYLRDHTDRFMSPPPTRTRAARLRAANKQMQPPAPSRRR
jgi:hypothetical protein